MTSDRAQAATSIRRVLLTADTIGGVWTFALDLARGLKRFDVQVVLATMGAPLRPGQRAQLAGLTHVVLRESNLKLEWMPDPWDDVARAGDWLLELARAHSPDVVHLNCFAPAVLSWPAPTLITAHSCVASWWRAVKGTDAPAEWSRYLDVVARGLHAADLVVAPSRSMAHALERHYGELRRVLVVPNGRDVTYVAPAKKSSFVLGVGRLWDEAKNLRMLAGIAPELPWPVFLAGETRGPDGSEVSLPHARLLGMRPPAELADFYARAAIYALPARYEPFGLSALEAALAGCALVLGDIDSLRETWHDAAIFVPPDNPEAWRNTLVTLIENHALRRRLMRAAQARAQRFNARRMAARYHEIYSELVARRQTAPGHPVHA